MVVQRPAGGAKNSLWRQWLVQPQNSLWVSHLARTGSLSRLVFGSSSEWVISSTDDLGELFLSRMAGNVWRSLVRSTVFIPGFRPPKLCVLQMNGAVCVSWSLCLWLCLSLRALRVFFRADVPWLALSQEPTSFTWTEASGADGDVYPRLTCLIQLWLYIFPSANLNLVTLTIRRPVPLFLLFSSLWSPNPY